MNEFIRKISGKSVNFLIDAGASEGLYSTLSLHKKYTLEDVLSDEDLTEESKEVETGKDQAKDVVENYQKFIRNLVNFMIREPKSSPNRINIFTTNYDLMFEQAFDQVVQEFPLVFFNDGSSGFIDKTISNDNYYIKASNVGYKDYYTREIPNINLFKLHGSISWRLEGIKRNLMRKKSIK